MKKETKKAVLITILTTSAFLLAIIPVLDFILYTPKEDYTLDWLSKIKFYHWSCFVVFGLAGYALMEVWTWKRCSGKMYPKVIAILFLLMSLLLAALCFFIAFMFKLPT